MKVGGKYNWKYQAEHVPLVYLGKKGSWHQFAKVKTPTVVWCEVQESDLHMIEETK